LSLDERLGRLLLEDALLPVDSQPLPIARHLHTLVRAQKHIRKINAWSSVG